MPSCTSHLVLNAANSPVHPITAALGPVHPCPEILRVVFSISTCGLNEHDTFRESVQSYRKLTSESSSLCRIGLISLTLSDWGCSIQ